MLTKGQKIIMYLLGALSLVIGIFTFVPFRAVPFFASEIATLDVEMIIKLIVFPLVIIGMSIYPNLVKYQQIYDCRERSKVINVMSYLPAFTYIVSLLTFLLHTLSYSSNPLGSALWTSAMFLVAGYLVFMIILGHFTDAVSMRLSKIGSIIADSLIGVIIIALAISTWKVCSQYTEFAAATQEFFVGDPFLFVLLIIVAFALVYAIKGLIKLIVVDEWSVYISATDATDNLPNIAVAEYNRAYNAILDDFENYFAELTEEEYEEDEEELDEELEEAPAEEAPAEEAPAEEAPAEEAPKPVKEPKVLSPAFDEVLAKARLIEGAEENSNEAQTVFKFSYEKKLFLILQKTTNDYRVAFLADNDDILKYIIRYPRVIIKPSSPKGDNWLLLINKGSFDAELLENIMNNSLKTLKRLLEEAKAAKEAEKEAKKAAKKAAK